MTISPICDWLMLDEARVYKTAFGTNVVHFLRRYEHLLNGVVGDYSPVVAVTSAGWEIRKPGLCVFPRHAE
jgi:hypothetical protein